jgi:hypothetical protein
MTSARCPYFSIEVETLAPPSTPRMRLPVYRCAACELMLQRLSSTDHEPVVASDGPASSNRAGGACCGPDFHTLSPSTCTRKRRASTCMRSFRQLLNEFGLDTSLPRKN